MCFFESITLLEIVCHILSYNLIQVSHRMFVCDKGSGWHFLEGLEFLRLDWKIAPHLRREDNGLHAILCVLDGLFGAHIQQVGQNLRIFQPEIFFREKNKYS